MVDLTFCVVSEDRGRFSGYFGVVVDIRASFLQTHRMHVGEEADTLFESKETRVFEGSFEFGLAAQDEGNSVLGIGVVVGHGFKAE